MYAIEYEIKSQDENSREEKKKEKTDQTDFLTVFRHLIWRLHHEQDCSALWKTHECWKTQEYAIVQEL